MNSEESYIIRGKYLITISVVCMLISIVLVLATNITNKAKEYSFTYETFNIKNMSKVSVAKKKQETASIISMLKLTEFPYRVKDESTPIPLSKPVEEQTPVIKPVVQVPTRPTWRLPTDKGYITQYPSYNHNSLDITSARGVYESIYPVADGTISNIYTDNAGALTVMINHNINGQLYMSQYVHLSSYAPGIYVGKYVTTDDRIGQMGATGIATGVHLHLAVLQCNFGTYPCQTIGHFSNYARTQYSHGFIGLQNLMYVPHSWTIR